MKILMQGRYDLLKVGGGDKIQIENTAKELRKLGVEVDVRDTDVGDLSSYDLVHVFQLDWTPETFFYASQVKKANKPLILSPIHHSVSEVKKFDDTYVFDFRRLSKILFNDQHHRDTFKNVYRSLFNSKKFGPTFKSVFLGLKNMHVKTLKMTDMVLVQTTAEARDLETTYGVKFSWKKIPNGVSENFLYQDKNTNIFGKKDYIISVGRIEPRKNQLKIIEAVKSFREKHNLDVALLFVGTKNGERHFEYKHLFNKALKDNSWVTHIESVPYAEMPSYYHFAKVGVSASWFETTGLTSLEALFCNTNAVAAGDRAREYLGDLVSYCDPSDVKSIERAVEKEYFAERPTVPSDMMNECTWSNAAAKTLDVYKEVLGAKKG